MNGKKAFGGLGLFFVIALVIGGIVSYQAYQADPTPYLGDASLEEFRSCNELSNAFLEAKQKSQIYATWGMMQTFGRGDMLMMETGAAPSAAGATPKYSETNIQVEGVDEADIVKTDGFYIYTLSGRTYRYGGGDESKLVIAKAYPAEQAEVVSKTNLGDFYPQEMFIHNDYVLLFGYTYEEVPIPETFAQEEDAAEEKKADQAIAPDIYPYPYYQTQFTTIKIYDVSDRSDPKVVRSLDFEGNYLSSRKIGDDVYFVVNSQPNYYIMAQPVFEGSEIIPMYRDMGEEDIGKDISFTSTCGCDDVRYFEPINPERFVTIASISLDDPEGEVKKEVIVGSGQNVYASLENFYVAEMNYPFWFAAREAGTPTEKTIIHKFSMDNGEVGYIGNMEAPGRVLNQFSMDEWDNHFRIATTVGRLTRVGGSTSNNVYVFDETLDMTGKIEDIAPGESIYSARFMGEKGYIVTFKKIDPFFVIDLSDHSNPRILGKLKIPGYSDYLHPYDDTHIIGIGKDTEAAEEERGDFAWYQGVKIAIFDVSDVTNPTEMHKVIIGDRGTDSYVLRDHKAFLFDREKNLLVIPILLAEMTENQKSGERQPSRYGEYKFQGAYVYDISLENGFELKGRITHYDEDDQTFLKSGYYYFDDQYSVKRSLYIEDVLYTISGMKIKLNDLGNLDEIKELAIGE